MEEQRIHDSLKLKRVIFMTTKRDFLFCFLMILPFSVFAIDKMDLLVCAAYQDGKTRLACFDGIIARLKSGEQITETSSKDDNNQQINDSQTPASTSEEISTTEYQINIPSDLNAKYFVVGKGGNLPNPILITKRVGQSGTSYSKRIFDCNSNTVKYLGTGSSIEEMNRSKPDQNMAPLVKGSIADYLWRHACGK